MKSGRVDQAKTQGLFYGWVVVAAAFCVALVAYGVQYSFGIFLEPLSEDFGWSWALLSGAASLFMFSRGALAILTGWATDRYGPRITVAIGGFFLGLGLILTSQISAAWQLYLFYGLMAGFGLSVAFAPLVATVSRWFVSKRGLAIGIVLAGIGMGTVVMSPLARYLVATYGWRLSYIIIGLLAWIIVIPGALFLRRSPEDKGLLPLGKVEAIASDDRNSSIAEKGDSLTSERAGFSLKDAAHTRAFWLLLAIIIFWSICVQMIMIHIYHHATDLNIPGVVAANFLVVLGIFSIIGRLVMGAVSDRLGGKLTLVICLVLQALAMFWLLRATDIWMLYLFAAVFGFAYGGCVPQLPVIAGEIFELKSIGAIIGVQMLGVAIGGAIGPLLGGYVFDVTGTYYFAFMVSGICTILALILLAFIRVPRKVRH
ncbi:MAG: MFS transporter [Dehalococcoidia bacterium]|nr:MFS transporter [Dehalococcoidia bacterium]